MKACLGVAVQIHTFLTLAVDGDELSASRSFQLTKAVTFWYPLTWNPAPVVRVKEAVYMFFPVISHYHVCRAFCIGICTVNLRMCV
jgi:hypothetical protein